MLRSDGLSAVERRKLLTSRICDLPLTVEDSPLAELVGELYEELICAGVVFRPQVYLSDDWGCPNLVPVIGVPFYLADVRLSRLVSTCRSCPVENEAEIIRYLRHEAGHAFNYAYRLFKEPEWKRLYGAFNQPYLEHFTARPFSPGFVRNIPGWYSQKHPDDDFAETFAAWLTPNSRWRERYAETQALAKLEYVEITVKRLGKTRPPVIDGNLDRPLAELNMTIKEWCVAEGAYGWSHVKLPSAFKYDLKDLFPAPRGGSLNLLLTEDSWRLMNEVHALTGTDSDLLFALVQELIHMIADLKLKVASGNETYARIKLAILLTTLAMNFQHTGSFVRE
jgi:hypothetical protein